MLLASSLIDTVAKKEKGKDLNMAESEAGEGKSFLADQLNLESIMSSSSCKLKDADLVRNGTTEESALVPSSSVNSHSMEKQVVTADLSDPTTDIPPYGVMNSMAEVDNSRCWQAKDFHVPDERSHIYFNEVAPCEASDLSNGILPSQELIPESVSTPSTAEAHTDGVSNAPESAGKEDKISSHNEQDLCSIRIFLPPMVETHTNGVSNALELVEKEENTGDHCEQIFCSTRVLDSGAGNSFLSLNSVEGDMHSAFPVVTEKEEETVDILVPNGVSLLSSTEEASHKSGKPLVKTFISNESSPPTMREDGGIPNSDPSVYLVQQIVDDELPKDIMSLTLEEESSGDGFVQGHVVGFPSTPVPCIHETLQKQGSGNKSKSFLDEEEVKHLEEAQLETVECLNGALSIDVVQKRAETHLESSKNDAFDEGVKSVSVSSKAEGSDFVPDLCHANLLNPKVDDDYGMAQRCSFSSNDSFKIHRKEDGTTKRDTRSLARIGHWAVSTERQICEGQSLDKDEGSSMESTAGSGWKLNGTKSPKFVDDANSCDSEDSASSPACVPPFQIRKKIDIHHQFVREIVKIQHDREQYDREQVEKQIQAQTLAHQGLRTTIISKEQKGNEKEYTHQRSDSSRSGRLNSNGSHRILEGPNHSRNKGLHLQTKSTFSQSREPSYENNEQDHVSSPFPAQGARQRRNAGQHKQLSMPIYRPPSARDPLATRVDEKRSRDSQNHTSAVVMGSSPDSSTSSVSDHHFPSIESPKLADMGIKVTFDTHKQRRHIKFSDGSNSTSEQKPSILVHSTTQASPGYQLGTSPTMRFVHDSSFTLSQDTSKYPSRKLERLGSGNDKWSQRGEKKTYTESSAIHDDVSPQVTHCSRRPQSDANVKQNAAELFGRDKKKSRKKSSTKTHLSSRDAQFQEPTPPKLMIDVPESQVVKSTRLNAVEEIGENPVQDNSQMIVGIERKGFKQATLQQLTPLSNDGSSFYTTPLLGKWGDIVDDFPDTYDYFQPNVEMDNNGSFGSVSYNAESCIYNSPVTGGLAGAASLKHGRSASKASSIDKGSRRHLTNSTQKDKVTARTTHIKPLGSHADETPARRSVWERLGPRNLSGESILGPPPKALNDRGASNKASGVASNPELAVYTPHVSFGPRSKHDAYAARRDRKDNM